MSDQGRKATDVIIELETKINSILNIVNNQNLLLKVISNKVNDILKTIDQVKSPEKASPKFTVEAVNTGKPPNVLISSENNMIVETKPEGFRRNSRPETYANKTISAQPIFPVKTPEIIVNIPKQELPEVSFTDTPSTTEVVNVNSNVNSVPVVQRVIDKTGKSLFLATVEVYNTNNDSLVSKTKTNGVGKWMAPLTPGNYKVIIKKKESLTKQSMEALHYFAVDGSKSPLELDPVVMK